MSNKEQEKFSNEVILYSKENLDILFVNKLNNDYYITDSELVTEKFVLEKGLLSKIKKGAHRDYILMQFSKELTDFIISIAK